MREFWKNNIKYNNINNIKYYKIIVVILLEEYCTECRQVSTLPKKISRQAKFSFQNDPGN